MPFVVDDAGKVVDTASRKSNNSKTTSNKSSSKNSNSGSSFGNILKRVSDAVRELPQRTANEVSQKISDINTMSASSREKESDAATPSFSSSTSVSPSVSTTKAKPADAKSTKAKSLEPYWSQLNDNGTEQSIQTSSMLEPRYASDMYDDAYLERDRINDIYEQDMIDSGMPVDYISNVLRTDNSVGSALNNELDPSWRSDLANSLTSAVDDGTMDRPHLLSDMMTGKQYYHYVHDLGMPGLSEDLIDVSDRARYSKSEQQRENGFTPYIPSVSYSIGKQFTLDPLAAVTQATSWMENLRENGFKNDVGYDITADTGYGRQKFPGKLFDRGTNGYLSQFNDLYSRAYNGDPDAMLEMTSEHGDEPYTRMVREWELPDGSLHYGVITRNEPGFDVGEKGMSDLLWSNVNQDTPLEQVFDKDGQPTNFVKQGNITYEVTDWNTGELAPVSVTSGDGFVIGLEPDPDNPDGGMRLKDDDSLQKWYDSHKVINVGFSDGSVATIPSSEAEAAIKKNKDGSYIKDNEWVPYSGTSLADVDPVSINLNVGEPTSLRDYYDVTDDTGSQLGMIYEPDMVLPDGTRISHDAALRIAQDKNPNDSDVDGIKYDFEPSGVNPGRYGPIGNFVGLADFPLLFTDSRPKRLMHEELFDEDGANLDEAPNMVANWATNSIPISLPYYQRLDALAKSLPYLYGVESGGRDSNGRYVSTGYEPGSIENSIKAALALFGPDVENLSGKFGHEGWLDRPMENLIKKRFAEGTIPNLLAEQAWDSTGEALEELIGNYVDEFGTYGLRNAWADPLAIPEPGTDVYDEDNKLLFSVPKKGPVPYGPYPVMYDEYGREIRDPNTPIDRRISNAFAPTPENLRDTANAMAGGAGVSWLYNLPAVMSGTIGIAGHNYMQNKNKSNSQTNFQDDIRDDIGNGNNDQMDVVDESDLPDIVVPNSLRGSDRIPYDPDRYIIPPNAPIR